MKRLMLFILPLAVVCSISQKTHAQWIGTPNNTTPTTIYNNNTANSRVGIGTTNPQQRLHVASGNLLLDYAPGSGSGNIYLGGTTASGVNGMRFSYNSGFRNGYIDVRTQGGTLDDGLLFRVDANNGGTERMRIRADGKIRIGNVTTPGNYLLYVKNGILTEKVKVAVAGSINWADYVFAPDYRLMPLSDVEQFVKTNSHLPNVPSSAELENSGLDLGQMQAKQMEKIEELTLYMIDMNKKMEGLQQENADLKLQIDQISKSIKQ